METRSGNAEVRHWSKVGTKPGGKAYDLASTNQRSFSLSFWTSTRSNIDLRPWIFALRFTLRASVSLWFELTCGVRFRVLLVRMLEILCLHSRGRYLPRVSGAG